MRAGRLKHKITVQTTTESQSGSGAVTDSWSTYAQPWAEIEPKGGREYFAAQMTNAKIDVVFLIRYQSGITAKMRISWNSRVFNILSVLNKYETGKELLIACEEVV